MTKMANYKLNSYESEKAETELNSFQFIFSLFLDDASRETRNYVSVSENIIPKYFSLKKCTYSGE